MGICEVYMYMRVFAHVCCCLRDSTAVRRLYDYDNPNKRKNFIGLACISEG